jgi:purine-binding chemotaxis protein CheW
MMEGVSDGERQLVVFDLAGESYGVEINTVREIIRMQEVTHVPDSPAYVEGVMNLRGSVIPVVDLRRRFGLAVTEATADSRVVVVDISGEGIGVIVDAVTEVLRISEKSVSATSTVITTEDSFYIEGIAKLDDRLLILLDIERALADQVEELLGASRAVAA